jgi:RNA polymerase sigma-70 factor (ECF subfamily)
VSPGLGVDFFLIFVLQAGTFQPFATLPLGGSRQHPRQDALPAFVLNSETLARKPMNDTPKNATNSSAQAEPQRPGMSDEHLMLAFTQGSSEAFTELFHRYKQPVYGFFCRRISDPANAEELTQETFFVLLRSRDRYQPRALFRTYLYAISFKILRAHRRKAAFRAAFLGHRNSRLESSKQDATEAGLWVRRAVEELDPLDREILILREFEQLRYAEIADLLQLPVNTVRSRLFRARTALRELLDPATATTSKEARKGTLEDTSQNAAVPGAQKGYRL